MTTRIFLLAGISFLFLNECVFSQMSSNLSLDHQLKQKVIDGVSKELLSNYVFEDTAHKMATFLETRLQNGSYDSIF
ncbi:MAG TPA: hypothetical protein VEV83_17480, partial [Parafilimonas sp.]|nr:hypothetical protein [Parafilimonas sp.]